MFIRTAQPRDIPAMIRLLRQVGQVHHQIRPDIFRPGTQKYDEPALAGLLTDPQKPIFVAVDETDAVLGYCFCQWRDYRGSDSTTPRLELYIDDLCVEETRRSKGIATALYRHAVSYAREKGSQFVILNVWCGNHSAMAFYEKMGLRPRNIMMEFPLEDTIC